MPDPTLHADPAAVEFDELPEDGTLDLLVCRPDPVERLEDRLLIFGRDSDPQYPSRIGDLESRFRRIGFTFRLSPPITPTGPIWVLSALSFWVRID